MAALTRSKHGGFSPFQAVNLSFLVLLLAAGGAAANDAGDETGEIELTTPVRLELKRLQDSWGAWTRAYFQDDEEKGRAALSQLLSVAESLSMEKLPDLSISSAAFAVLSAEEGNLERARWAVDSARQLDSGRPEADFASASVERAAGNYLGALRGSFQGYAKLFRLPLEGHVWKQNIGIGVVYLLTFTGGLFVLLFMACRGADLFHDVGRLFSPPLHRGVADAVALVLLVWPLVLPSGVLWLVLYWSVLLWGYGTVTQRAMLTCLWVVLGLAPVATAYHQREVQQTLLPANRAVENLKARRLYGALFLDLEVLHNLMGDSTVITEVVADLHRDFGQWEHARVIYNRMAAADPGARAIAPALNNIGVYHHRRGDYGAAVNYFSDAKDADPSLAECFFNLSQSHNQNFNFTEAHEALAEAKRLAADRVASWEASQGGAQGNVIPINGGLRRAAEIRAALVAMGQESEPPSLLSRAHMSLGVALAASVFAVALSLWRRKKGYPSSRFVGRPELFESRWLRGLVPGWHSTLTGRGFRTFLAILFPLALLGVPVLRAWGYPQFLGYDAGPDPVTFLCLVILVVYLGVRLTRTR